LSYPEEDCDEQADRGFDLATRSVALQEREDLCGPLGWFSKGASARSLAHEHESGMWLRIAMLTSKGTIWS